MDIDDYIAENERLRVEIALLRAVAEAAERVRARQRQYEAHSGRLELALVTEAEELLDAALVAWYDGAAAEREGVKE